MKRFFYLQRNDRRTLTVLLAAAVAVVAVIVCIGKDGESDAEAMADSTKAVAEGRLSHSARNHTEATYAVEGREVRLFAFDPNTADSSQLLSLGLAPWQVRAIYKYRAAGGVYTRPSDFARLYGLTAGHYKRLEPYIRISADYQPASEIYAGEPRNMRLRDTARYPLKLKHTQRIALNEADTAALKTVPGIGSWFARAIVDYRERLGGYHDVGQLLEISGLPTTALQYFVLGNRNLRRLNLNTAPMSQLRRHPYIGFYQAKTIIDHRRMKGPLRNIEELGLYRDFPKEAIDRLRPYAEF